VSCFTTACPRNCYSTCAMTVEVEDGRLRRLDAHPGNDATATGPCLKGLSYVERVYSPDRILHPLRRNPRTGAFGRLSWDAALDEVAERLIRYRRDPGPQSILFYSASGTKGLMNRIGARFWRLYGGYTTTYGDLCWPAGLEATRLTLGDNAHNAPHDLASARLIVFWGKNPAETNIHQMVFADRALDAGATLVVIDPRRTPSAERAALLVQPRPGTDGALALAVAHLLIKAGAIDREFIARHVHGFDAFAAGVEAWTPERAAGVTDVPVRFIHRLAELFAAVRPATISAGFGLQRFTNGGQAMRAMLALLAITGNIGRPGAGWVYANLQSHVFDEVRDPIAFYPPPAPDGVARVSISTAKLGPDMLAQREPPLRMAWVERGNPIPQNPQTGTVIEAFRALDFRVVVDQFLTDTAREADLVVPAKTMFEQTDVIGAYWHAYLQIKQKVIEPPGEVKPESEIYRLLADRLGMREADDPAVFPVTDVEVEAYLARMLAPFPGVTLERLREGPVLAPGHREIAFSDFVFPTPSGKIELDSREAVERWGVSAVPDYVEPIESVRRPDPDPTVYPLHLLTPNTKNRIHSQFGNLRMIRQFDPKPFVSMSPEDAQARGIADGGVVRVFNGRGALTLDARLDHGVRPGCVCITNGWWITDGAAVNLLSAARETDMGYGAAFHENRVQVEPVEAGLPPSPGFGGARRSAQRGGGSRPRIGP
jgi:anaerobic selenocysteine-containing dehydrogenase